MSRMIDADALIAQMEADAEQMEEPIAKMFTYAAIRDVKHAPTIEERKKGKWIWVSSTYDRTPCEMRYMCSECHHETILHSNEASYPWEKFCPNCGSDNREAGDKL